MLLHSAPSLRIYFGNAEDELDPQIYLHLPPNTKLLEHSYFAPLEKLMHLDEVLFLKQTHSASGLVCTEDNLSQVRSFQDEGDFLMTHVQHIGLGVMTADCLPIVLYDSRNHAAAIVHAGWRGSAQGIVLRALESMQQEYNTALDHLQVFFGPSAKICCYQVGQDLIAKFDDYPYASHAFQWHGEEVFFDLPGFNKLQLESIGVKKEAFHWGYSICTICDDKFYSYRRQKEQAGRQMTVVSLQ
jgi:YfiH family protein